jgi:hypothetical protein
VISRCCGGSDPIVPAGGPERKDHGTAARRVEDAGA